MDNLVLPKPACQKHLNWVSARESGSGKSLEELSGEMPQGRDGRLPFHSTSWKQISNINSGLKPSGPVRRQGRDFWQVLVKEEEEASDKRRRVC